MQGQVITQYIMKRYHDAQKVINWLRNNWYWLVYLAYNLICEAIRRIFG